MSELKVTFHNPEEILSFVNIVSKYEADMDMRRGKFIVDAKSLLGIMNLGFNNIIELKVYEDDCDTLREEISSYIAA